jgi:hypothetical protein
MLRGDLVHCWFDEFTGLLSSVVGISPPKVSPVISSRESAFHQNIESYLLLLFLLPTGHKGQATQALLILFRMEANFFAGFPTDTHRQTPLSPSTSKILTLLSHSVLLQKKS